MLSFFPLDVLDEIWDLIESVSEGFLTYTSIAEKYCRCQVRITPAYDILQLIVSARQNFLVVLYAIHGIDGCCLEFYIIWQSGKFCFACYIIIIRHLLKR